MLCHQTLFQSRRKVCTKFVSCLLCLFYSNFVKHKHYAILKFYLHISGDPSFLPYFLGWSHSTAICLYAPSPNPTRTPRLPRKKNERSLVQEQHLLALGNRTWVVSCSVSTQKKCNLHDDILWSNHPPEKWKMKQNSVSYNLITAAQATYK